MLTCPGDLEILLHYHVSPEEHLTVSLPGNCKVIERFLACGVLEKRSRTGQSSSHNSSYQTTLKGAAWIDLILKTPMPVQQWVDPRDLDRRAKDELCQQMAIEAHQAMVPGFLNEEARKDAESTWR